MNTGFEKRLLTRAGRLLVAGILGCCLFLSLSGPIASLGLARGAANFGPTSESEPEENNAKELEALAREMGIRSTSRRLVGVRQLLATSGTVARGTATTGLALTRVRQISPLREHDRRNGFGAPLRC